MQSHNSTTREKRKHINFKCFPPKSVSKYLINQKIENEIKDFFHDFTEYLNFYISQIFDLECSELWILMNLCSYQKYLRNLLSRICLKTTDRVSRKLLCRMGYMQNVLHNKNNLNKSLISDISKSLNPHNRSR